MKRRTVRLSTELDKQIVDASAQRGFGNPTAFIRTVLRAAARQGEQTEFKRLEQKLTASVEKVESELRTIRESQAALASVLDAFVKTFLTCVPEPPRETYDQAVARAMARYGKLIRSAAVGMNGQNGQAELRAHVKN